MDMLKRELAPLSDAAWSEIDKRAIQVVKNKLSTRKVVKVTGPKGWDYTVLSVGRTMILENERDKPVKVSKYQVKPLVETYISFTLDRTEMDDISRGARDIKLDALEDAMEKIAFFEEQAVYNGYLEGGIKGLIPGAEKDPVSIGEEDDSIMEALSTAVLMMKDVYQSGPYTLVTGEKIWKRLNAEGRGYPVMKRVTDLIGGKVIFSDAVSDALLVPYDHEDLELVVGGDFSIGYEAHDSDNVYLFAVNSFTFRVIDPSIIVTFKA